MLGGALIACSVPVMAHAQPLAVAPVGATYRTSDTGALHAAAIPMLEPAVRSRAQTAKKGLRVGAAWGAVVGLVVSQAVLSGSSTGCDLGSPRDSQGRQRCSSNWASHLRYGAKLSLAGGVAGGVLGSGVGALRGATPQPSVTAR